MKILIVTPLYPPDTASPAPYSKELATRLSNMTSGSPKLEVSIVTYADIPEKIPNITIYCTSKRKPRLFRIFALTSLLLSAAKNADVLFVENGASVELPMYLASFLIRKPFILHISDISAHAHAQKNSLLGRIERLAVSRAKEIITETPLGRPEILPFAAYPTNEFALYEKSWDNHLHMLLEKFHHGTH